ncbi:hypothetical protein [Pseudomonas hamedanensis]|uniref:Uncharacterized protein n=1 Tax=Pseudomonas hamedanensis TaxID=2745504 RepID=A0A9E6NVU6_9PSED|nr:hypothetical protein [Pseudomonas hamedanensis]QXI15317.1 hypothetical protein HU739_015455 [Pseudomonas hamedanensis]
MPDKQLPVDLKKKIQQLMIDVSGPDYGDIRVKSENFYIKINQPDPKNYYAHLSVEAKGSDTYVSTEDFVSKINQYLRYDGNEEISTEEAGEIIGFQRMYAPYTQNVMYEDNGKKMYCSVSIFVEIKD